MKFFIKKLFPRNVLWNKLTKAINYEFLDQNYEDWNQSKSFQPIARQHYPYQTHTIKSPS